MAEESKIEWTHATFNPWIGCNKVSPACDHCYAEVSTPARTLGVEWGSGKPRQRTSAANWRQPLRWNRADFRQCGDCGWHGEIDTLEGDTCPACGKHENLNPARRRVFCASLADVFDNEVSPHWRAELISLIANTPNLDWLLLTKRIGNATAMLDQAMRNISGDQYGWDDSHRLPNVWIGATICNQTEADRDVMKLLRVPAAVRFLSIEPMLGPVDLRDIDLGADRDLPREFWTCVDDDDNPPAIGLDALTGLHWQRFGDWDERREGIDWVIAGGESGPHARPMHPDWARSLRDQCAAAGVPFLLKQWGDLLPEELALVDGEPEPWRVDPNGNRAWRLNETFLSRESLEPVVFSRVGKKAAGRLLDGVLHDGYPEVRQ